MKIEWRGNQFTNKSSRNGYKPLAIVNHVVAGSGSSCDNWFRSSGNKVSSAHFCVWENGRITQYVKLEDMAWANGLTLDNIKYSTSEFIRSIQANPNLYTVSIEHAGHTGKLTKEQLEATVWLHRHIRDEVKRIWGHEIPLIRRFVLGHYEIDPKRKPNCPGPDFPWNQLLSRLGKEEKAMPKIEGKATITYKGKQLQGIIVDSVSYVPVRDLAQLMGLKVDWNANTKTVELK